jgi:predicted PurR-regulated permease PerM
LREKFTNLVLHNFFKMAMLIILVGLFFYIMMPFMVAIVLGAILAMALAPFVDFFIRRGLSRGASLVVFSFLLGFIGIVVIGGFVIRGARIVSEQMRESNIAEMSLRFTSSMQQFVDHICKIYGLDKTFVNQKFTSMISYGGATLSSFFNDFVSELPVIIMMGFITTLAVYCFLRESDKIRILFDRYFYFERKNGDDFIRMCKVCCREVFFSNIITGVLQASIVSIAALIFGVGDFYLIFFITFVVSFVPVIGAAPVAAILGLQCFMDSRFGAGIGMLVFAAVAGVIDNIIRPFLGTLGEVEVHPFIGLVAVIGGVIMFSLPGLFIGPLVASLIFGALPIIVEEFFPPMDKAELKRPEEETPLIVSPSQ